MSVNTDKLLKMAEQIAANMNYTDDQDIVAAKVADHINRFWDPRMKSAFSEYAVGNSSSLSPILQRTAPLID